MDTKEILINSIRIKAQNEGMTLAAAIRQAFENTNYDATDQNIASVKSLYFRELEEGKNPKVETETKETETVEDDDTDDLGITDDDDDGGDLAPNADDDGDSSSGPENNINGGDQD